MGMDLSLGVPEWPSSSAILDLQESFKLNLSDIYSYPTPISDEETSTVLSVLSEYFLLDPIDDYCLSVHNGGRAAIHDILKYYISIGVKDIFLQQPCWFGYNEILSNMPLVSHSISEFKPNDLKKLILICLPNNPDGQINLDFDLDEHTTVVIDLVYFSFLSDRDRENISSFISLYSNQVLLILSTSKTCCAPGVRIAYVVSRNSDITTQLRALQKGSYNLPSNLNRSISTTLWKNKDEIEKARSLYVDLRTVAESAFAASNLDYTIFGMFVWVTINEVNADEVISEVQKTCGYIGASGLRFGSSNGTRWALRMGVSYKTLAEALVTITEKRRQHA